MELHNFLLQNSMPSPAVGSGLHNTRAATQMALNKTKAEDDHKKQAGLEVKDPATALEFLMEGDFTSEEDDMTFDLLSIISMQLSQ